MVELISPKITAGISHDDIQARMGVPQPEFEISSAEPQGEEGMSPAEQGQMEELRQIFEEVAEAAFYLCSPAAGGVSGEIVHVDGGYNVMGM